MKLYSAVIALAISTASAEEGTPPWASLSTALSSPSILTVPTIDAFVSECAETFLSDTTMTNPTPEGEHDGPPHLLQEGNNWMLVDQPSKLCTTQLTCAFTDCYYPDLLTPGDNAEEIFTDTVGALTQNKEHLALPIRVVQPVSVGDVVASMKWAYEHKVPVSIKTGGNNWGGASAGGGTLSINTRSLPAYAMRAADSIHECGESGTEEDPPACRLALARGKTAIIRVGGGELWDAVLQAVSFHNGDPARTDGKRYMVVSGSAGTVAPAGGWLASGGMAGMRGMRQYGFGVDQVLQMEMVIPNGTHVRFAPEEWEEDPEYLYPKTTKVKGYCNENPEADEDEWIWKECDVVDFNELWMAARGGGGGTWGIVTSLTYQLHPNTGFYLMKFLPLTTDDAWKTILGNETMVDVMDETVQDFKLEFYFNPSALNVTEEDSNAFNHDSPSSPHFSLPPYTRGAYESMGTSKSGAEAWAAAWRMFLMEGRGKERLLQGGFSEDQIEEMAGWAYGSEWREKAATFAEPLVSDEVKAANPGLDDVAIVDQWFNIDDLPGVVEGNIPEGGPQPSVYALSKYYGYTSTIISTKHVLEARDTLVPFLARLDRGSFPWYVTGGALLNTHDQITAIPLSRREGGLQLTMTDMMINPDVLETMFPIMFGDLDPSTDTFPGFVGHNHYVRHGPLKEDWTKPCPITYTLDEMDKLCISEQEAVWGTELLARLENFKAKIDPDGIMTCPTGVGFTRAAAEQKQEASTEPVEVKDASEPSGSSSNAPIAKMPAALFGTFCIFMFLSQF